MDPNLYHLSRPLIRNVRNWSTPRRFRCYMCTVSSAISRSIYQNVSPLIRVSGYLPILLDNFQERGKRWCFVGRRREVASKSKKWMESTRKRRKNFRDYLISIYSKFKKLIKVSIIYSAHKSYPAWLGNKASTFLLQVRFLSSYCAKGSGTFLLLALLLLVPHDMVDFARTSAQSFYICSLTRPNPSPNLCFPPINKNRCHRFFGQIFERKRQNSIL